jgi:hypothetical protein
LDNGRECSVYNVFFTIYRPKEKEDESYRSLYVPLNIPRELIGKIEGSERVTLSEFEELFANDDFPGTATIRNE